MFSSYKLGAQSNVPDCCPDLVLPDASLRYVEETEVGAWIATPGFLLDEIRRLKGEIEQTGGQIFLAVKDRNPSEYPALNRFIKSVWSPFVKEYDNFYRQHLSWTDRMWGSLYDTIRNYRERFKGLHAETAKLMSAELGIQLRSPAPKDPVDLSIWDKLGSFAKTVIWVFVGMIGLYLVFRLVSNQ